MGSYNRAWLQLSGGEVDGDAMRVAEVCRSLVASVFRVTCVCRCIPCSTNYGLLKSTDINIIFDTKIK